MTSARVGAAWRKGGPNALRFIADKTFATPRCYLPDCPDGHVRVAVFIPPRRIPEAFMLAGSKFGRVVGSKVLVRLFAEQVDAGPVDECMDAAPARACHAVVMPVWGDDDEA